MLLKTPRDEPSPALALQLLAHEYNVLQGLALSGVVRPRAFLRDDCNGCLNLEDRGETSLQAWLAISQCNLQAFFPLALQLATILVELHRRESIHNAINRLGVTFYELLTGHHLFVPLTLWS